MKFKAFFNRDGGTFRTTDMEAFARRTADIFEAAGHEISVAVVSGEEIAPALRQAAETGGIDGIVAGGGDGTISTAAGIAWKSGLVLGVVPAGTMNLFARSLKLPLDPEAALHALAKGQVAAVDIASANGRPFVHQFSAGLHARMVRYRERMDYASRLGKIRATARAAYGVIRNPPAFDVEFTIGGEHHRRRVSAVSVSNNVFGGNPFLVPDDVSGGRLGFYVADALRPPGVAQLALDILRGRLKENEAVAHWDTPEVELHFPRAARSSRCVIDGELVPMPHEVLLKIHAGELRVLTGSPPGA
ncbi:diacylglycerol kinase family lipid kinase [Rhizobiaceae bacterium BDR2-2]|uniref:Diacylglycerol kinase family lipid kinase n=1 Tax=Ectorhizobium quercum TaxID=2965071 RepID=A0AAE3SWX5_9HYPH|nr:diacylglycerol kinase family protein [Ectorhizobium quercum]MCX8999173.1 diacylglycerol kinase family lipid kinase [Ectorhizobium quercum]